ncbi:hypothetical protein [Streptomyces huiliensis]|uniref:hypothetical protein n=1 Tax=Streptomyces huiliensis TaxID=2876027 RepID=UPI001CBDC9EC|nr:hypothetical protein [Streptomyces huiliensis]MBZ4318980.1 hypothetical protein [Streptomyces huiliensis]
MPETIRWTVLPDGTAADGRLRLTVLVSPRLTGGTTLDAFPAFHDWPDTLRRYATALQVEFRAPGTTGSGTAVPTAPRTDRYPPADSDLWKALFPTSSPVRPPAGAFAAAAAVPPILRSYPGRAVHDRIGTLYETVATATAYRKAFPESGEGAAATPPGTWDHPTADDLRAPLPRPLLDLARGVAAAYPGLDELIEHGTGGPSAIADNPFRPRYMDRNSEAYRGNAAAHNLAEAYRFYDRPQVPAPPPPTAPDVDFHNACALLADYPELLRRFGLAVDLLVAPPPALADRWQARVLFTAAQGQLNEDEHLRPWTALRYVAGSRFEPYAADDGPYGRGMLRLGGDGILVTDLDVDGAAMKFVEFSRIVEQTLAARSDPKLSVAPDSTATPALHSAGLTVFRESRDVELADRMEADARHTAGVAPTGQTPAVAVLDAADLVRGYRVDVGLVETVAPAEGGTEASADGGTEASGDGGSEAPGDGGSETSNPGDGGTDAPAPADSGTDAPATTWRPLCARTGGYAIRRPGQPVVPLVVAPDEGHVKASAVTHDKRDDNQLYVHQAVAGWHGWSLAAPPPGRTLGPDDRPRVPAPEVSPVFPLDTTFRPVKGSLPALRFGRTYRLRARLCDLAGNGLGPGADTPDGTATVPVTYRRWEPVPPPALVPRWPFLEGESEPRLVIRSTVHDDGTPVPPDVWAALRNGQVPDHRAQSPVDGLDRRYRGWDERHVSPPKTPLQTAEQHGVYDAVFGPAKADVVRRRYFAAASREAGSYLDTVVSLPENPDVTTDLKLLGEIKVAKHDVHDPVPPTELPVPRGQGLRPGEYVVHRGAQLLLPYLPDVPARGVSLRGLPGAPPNATYDFPGPWPQARPLRLKIVEGDGPPVWSGLLERELTVRLPKATVATVRMSCRLDPADLTLFNAWQLLTASKLWNDPDPTTGLPQEKKDELTTAAANGENWMLTPWVELTLIHAVEKPLAEPELGPLTFPREAEQTSTRFSGRLRSHARSTGRVDIDATWHEWNDDVAQDAPQRAERHERVGHFTLEPYENDRSLSGLRHEFRDTLHRAVTYTPTATTRFREYFHPAITDQPALITRTGPASAGPDGHGWHVPSSRRPEPPDVSHLVPTVRWQQTVDHERHRVTRTRRHAGFRAHLRRPWFSSGDDELLAVVLDPVAGGPGAGTPLPDELVTRCGTDPVWADPTALPRLTPANFPGAVLTADGRVLAEPVGGAAATASVAAFAPGYDHGLRLWTCDIDVDLGAAAGATAYFPYLRLALARYQPYSVDPLHLSKVVTADFLQLLPDRTIAATMTAAGAIRLELSGPVALNALGKRVGTGQAAMAASRRVLATVERRAVGSGDLDWAGTGTVLELTCVPKGSTFVWSGDLVPPAPQLIPLSEYRLVVEEHEVYATDSSTATGTVTPAGGGTAVPVSRRLVHADRFALAVTPLGRIILRE